MAKYEVTLTQAHFYTIEIETTDPRAAESAAWDILRSSGTDAFTLDGRAWEDSTYVEEIE